MLAPETWKHRNVPWWKLQREASLVQGLWKGEKQHRHSVVLCRLHSQMGWDCNAHIISSLDTHHSLNIQTVWSEVLSLYTSISLQCSLFFRWLASSNVYSGPSRSAWRFYHQASNASCDEEHTVSRCIAEAFISSWIRYIQEVPAWAHALLSKQRRKSDIPGWMARVFLFSSESALHEVAEPRQGSG